MACHCRTPSAQRLRFDGIWEAGVAEPLMGTCIGQLTCLECKASFNIEVRADVLVTLRDAQLAAARAGGDRAPFIAPKMHEASRA